MVPEQAKFLVIVNSIINNAEQKILILKRSPKREYNPGKWELPGGKVALYESLKSAVENLVFTDYGISITSNDNRYYCNNHFISEGKYKGYEYLELTTGAKLIAGSVDISIDEYTQFEWIKIEDAFDYDLTINTLHSLTKYYEDVKKLENLDEPNERPVIIVGRALIKNKDDKFLFIKRSETNTYPNTWELPGGKLNMLETIDNAVIREVFEETNLVLKIKNLVLYINSYIENSGRHRGYTYVNFVSDTQISSGKIKLTEKHSAYKWVTKKEIQDLELSPYMGLQISEIFFK